jgi:hypothetical protein
MEQRDETPDLSMIHLEVVNGVVIVGLPDQSRGVVVNVEMTGVLARELAEALFKAGASADAYGHEQA